MTMAAAGARDGRGRFVPGVSGNPAGKKPGTLNKATLWRQSMEEGDELAGRRRMIAQMREGDLRATMYILKAIDGPDRKVAAIALPIPPGSDVATVFGSIKAKMILGEVSPDEALAWFTALEKGVKVVHAQLERGDANRRMDAASAVAAAAEGEPEPEPDGEDAPPPDHEREREIAAASTNPEAGVPASGPTDGVAGTAAPPAPDAAAAPAIPPAAPQAAAPAAAPVPPVAAAPVPPVPQPCFSPAFPGRRRSIVAARTAAEEAARRAAVPPLVYPTGEPAARGG